MDMCYVDNSPSFHPMWKDFTDTFIFLLPMATSGLTLTKGLMPSVTPKDYLTLKPSWGFSLKEVIYRIWREWIEKHTISLESLWGLKVNVKMATPWLPCGILPFQFSSAKAVASNTLSRSLVSTKEVLIFSNTHLKNKTENQAYDFLELNGNCKVGKGAIWACALGKELAGDLFRKLFQCSCLYPACRNARCPTPHLLLLILFWELCYPLESYCSHVFFSFFSS